MKPTEKRKSTQLGLGKVTAEPRHSTTKRERVDADVDVAGEDADSLPPISAPAPSGVPQARISAGPPQPRHTLPIDSRSPVERSVDRAPLAPSSSPSPSPPATVRSSTRPGQERVERIASDPPPTSVRAARTPIEVTQVDTKRLRASAPSNEKRDSRPARFGAEEPTGRRPIRRTESGRPESLRPESGRPVSARPVSARPVSARPVSARPEAAPARSARMSIREDNVGAAVHADAVREGRAGRAVPKVLKSKAEIAAAPIDHRAGFLLAHIDGVTTVAGLVDICGMPEDQVNEILERLRRLGIVAIR